MAPGVVVVAWLKLSRRGGHRGRRAGVEQPAGAREAAGYDGSRWEGDEHEAARGEPRQPLERARPAGGSLARRLAHALAQGRGGGGPADCSSAIRSAVGHRLLPSPRVSQRPAEPRGHGGRADAEHAGGLLAVQLDHDPEHDHLALAGAQLGERRLQRRGQPFDEVRLLRLGRGDRLLAAPPVATRRGTSRAPSCGRCRAARSARSPGGDRSAATSRSAFSNVLPERSSARLGRG